MLSLFRCQVSDACVITLPSLSAVNAEIALHRAAHDLSAADYSDTTVLNMLEELHPEERRISQTLSTGDAPDGFDGFPLTVQLMGAYMRATASGYTESVVQTMTSAFEATRTHASGEISRVSSMISLDRVATGDDQHVSIAAAWELIRSQLSECERFVLRCIAILHVSYISGRLARKLAMAALSHSNVIPSSVLTKEITTVDRGTPGVLNRQCDSIQSTIPETQPRVAASKRSIMVSCGSKASTQFYLCDMADCVLDKLVQLSLLTHGKHTAEESAVWSSSDAYYFLHRAFRRAILDNTERMTAPTTAVHAVLEQEVSAVYNDVLSAAFSGDALVLLPESRHTDAVHLCKHVSSALERKHEVPRMTSGIRPLDVFVFAVNMHEGRMVEAVSCARILELELTGRSHTDGPRLKYMLGAALHGQQRFHEAATHLRQGLSSISPSEASQVSEVIFEKDTQAP